MWGKSIHALRVVSLAGQIAEYSRGDINIAKFVGKIQSPKKVGDLRSFSSKLQQLEQMVSDSCERGVFSLHLIRKAYNLVQTFSRQMTRFPIRGS